MIISVLSIIVNYVTAVIFTRVLGLGHSGLAVATSMVALFAFIVLFSILRARIGGVYGRELVAGFQKVALASVAMGGAVFLSSHQMARWFGESQMAHRADLAVSLPLGVAVFYMACRVLGVTDLDMALRAVLAPARRRLSQGPRP